MDERQSIALLALQTACPHLLAGYYCEEIDHFDTKLEECEEMAFQLKKAMIKRIKSLHWMHDETKKVAIAKIHPKLEHQMSSGLHFERKAFIDNVFAGFQFHFNTFVIDRWDQSCKQHHWEHGSTAGGFIDPVALYMGIPAAVLRSPFSMTGEIQVQSMYEKAMIIAYNYGALGAIIGHELTHMFDRNGSIYDDKAWSRSTFCPRNE